MLPTRQSQPAVIGRFLFGAPLPGDAEFQEALRLRCGDVVSLVPLPVFFALSGLITDRRLLLGPMALLVPLVIALAMLGTFSGGHTAARLRVIAARSALSPEPQGLPGAER